MNDSIKTLPNYSTDGLGEPPTIYSAGFEPPLRVRPAARGERQGFWPAIRKLLSILSLDRLRGGRRIRRESDSAQG
jgi:hypothetical protein